MPEPFTLNTDLESAVACLETPADQRPQFVLPSNLFHFHKTKAADKHARRGIKKLISPENALAVIPFLPEGENDRTHCILRGDFVLCDLIPTIIAARGPCAHVRIATLGMSAANAETLAVLVEQKQIRKLTIIVSHYFQQVDKTTTYHAVKTRLGRLATLITTRSHAKVILLPTLAGDFFSIEGSANLRSSDNLEQMAILNDRLLFNFHAAWIDGLAQK